MVPGILKRGDPDPRSGDPVPAWYRLRGFLVLACGDLRGYGITELRRVSVIPDRAAGWSPAPCPRVSEGIAPPGAGACMCMGRYGRLAPRAWTRSVPEYLRRGPSPADVVFRLV